MMAESKKGVSAKQLERMLGVSYKTAWYLCHRIRAAMGDEPASTAARHRGSRRDLASAASAPVSGSGPYAAGNKTVVVGAVERGGEVRLRVHRAAGSRQPQQIPERGRRRRRRSPLHRQLDRLQGQGDGASRAQSTEAVDHSTKEWVRGDVHTNTVENVWSLFKRSVIGSYHQVSVKHLPAYLDEFEWRYNNRDNPLPVPRHAPSAGRSGHAYVPRSHSSHLLKPLDVQRLADQVFSPQRRVRTASASLSKKSR